MLRAALSEAENHAGTRQDRLGPDRFCRSKELLQVFGARFGRDLMLDPESFRVSRVFVVNGDVCMEFRSKNSMGGYVQGAGVYSDYWGKFSQYTIDVVESARLARAARGPAGDSIRARAVVCGADLPAGRAESDAGVAAGRARAARSACVSSDVAPSKLFAEPGLRGGGAVGARSQAVRNSLGRIAGQRKARNRSTRWCAIPPSFCLRLRSWLGDTPKISTLL